MMNAYIELATLWLEPAVMLSAAVALAALLIPLRAVSLLALIGIAAATLMLRDGADPLTLAAVTLAVAALLLAVDGMIARLRLARLGRGLAATAERVAAVELAHERRQSYLARGAPPPAGSGARDHRGEGAPPTEESGRQSRRQAADGAALNGAASDYETRTTHAG